MPCIVVLHGSVNNRDARAFAVALALYRDAVLLFISLALLDMPVPFAVALALYRDAVLLFISLALLDMPVPLLLHWLCIEMSCLCLFLWLCWICRAFVVALTLLDMPVPLSLRWLCI